MSVPANADQVALPRSTNIPIACPGSGQRECDCAGCVTGREAALASAEAARRLEQYGPNAVAEARPSGLLVLARMFWGLGPWMLEAAIGIDLYLGRWVDAGVIGALLVFNAIVGFFQQAGRSRRSRCCGSG